MADVADRALSLVLTQDYGTRLREIRWVALSNDPKRIYTLEWVTEARDASPYDAADFDSSELRIVARDADDAEALEHIDEPVFGGWSGCSVFLVSGDGRWFVTLLETDRWFLCIRDHALGRTTRVEIPGRVISPAVRWVGDGVTVMVGTDHDHVRLFDVRTADALGDFRGGDLVISEDGALIALRDDACVTLVRHAEAEEVGRWTLSHPSPRRFAAISQSPLGVWCIDADHGAAASHIWWCEPGREPLDLTHLAPRDVIVGATMHSNELALITARGRVVKVRRDREASAVTFDATRHLPTLKTTNYLVGKTGLLLAETEEAFTGKPSPVTFLPYLSGERTPHNNPHAKGVLFGLTASTGPTQVTQAVLEGIALSLADAQGYLEETGALPDRIAINGGGSRSRFWCRIIASALGKTVLLQDGSEAGPAFGATRLARIAATGEEPAAVCPKPPVEAEIVPDPALAEAYAAKLTAFRTLYQAVSPHFRLSSN